MNSMTKALFLLGAVALMTSGLFWILGKTGIPLGRLPGDIHVTGEKSSFRFPIVTCIVISVALTVLINLILSIFRK